MGWHEPVWSFDVHSAALSILGMATDGNSGLVMPGGVSLAAVPVLPYLLTNGAQNSMSNWATVQKVVDCASAVATPATQQFFNALVQCTSDISIEHYKKFLVLVNEGTSSFRYSTARQTSSKEHGSLTLVTVTWFQFFRKNPGYSMSVLRRSGKQLAMSERQRGRVSCTAAPPRRLPPPSTLFPT